MNHAFAFGIALLAAIFIVRTTAWDLGYDHWARRRMPTIPGCLVARSWQTKPCKARVLPYSRALSSVEESFSPQTSRDCEFWTFSSQDFSTPMPIEVVLCNIVTERRLIAPASFAALASENQDYPAPTEERWVLHPLLQTGGVRYHIQSSATQEFLTCNANPLFDLPPVGTFPSIAPSPNNNLAERGLWTLENTPCPELGEFKCGRWTCEALGVAKGTLSDLPAATEGGVPFTQADIGPNANGNDRYQFWEVIRV